MSEPMCDKTDLSSRLMRIGHGVLTQAALYFMDKLAAIFCARWLAEIFKKSLSI